MEGSRTGRGRGVPVGEAWPRTSDWTPRLRRAQPLGGRCRRLGSPRRLRWKAGAGFAGGLSDVDWLVTFVADDFGVHVVAAGEVVKHEGCAFWPGQPLVAPGGHGSEDWVDLSSLVGEAVLVAQRSFLVRDPHKEALFNEFGQVVGKYVTADA